MQLFSKECKYIEKEKKVVRYIANNLEIVFDDSDEEQLSFNKLAKKVPQMRKIYFLYRHTKESFVQ